MIYLWHLQTAGQEYPVLPTTTYVRTYEVQSVATTLPELDPNDDCVLFLQGALYASQDNAL